MSVDVRVIKYLDKLADVYVLRRPVESFPDGFLVSISLPGTDLKYLIKILIFK